MVLGNETVRILHPKTLENLPATHLDSLVGDVLQVALVFRVNGTQQRYAKLRQLPEYQHVPLTARFGALDTEGAIFHVKFLQRSNIKKHAKNGFLENDYRADFTQCDLNPNSLMMLYKNSTWFWQRSVNYNVHSHRYFTPIVQNTIVLDSALHLPAHYFTGIKMFFGGCGGGAYSKEGGLIPPSIFGLY